MSEGINLSRASTDELLAELKWRFSELQAGRSACTEHAQSEIHIDEAIQWQRQLNERLKQVALRA